MTDKVTEAVVAQLRTRAEKGKEKYGTTMERNDLTLIQWLQHLQEELMDAAVYLVSLSNPYNPKQNRKYKTQECGSLQVRILS